MDETVGAVGFLVVGLLLAAYGINGIAKRRIMVFARGSMPKLCEGSEAISNGIITTVFGVGFAALGALFLFISLHA